jgi:hypothetical protein
VNTANDCNGRGPEMSVGNMDVLSESRRRPWPNEGRCEGGPWDGKLFASERPRTVIHTVSPLPVAISEARVANPPNITISAYAFDPDRGVWVWNERG